MQLRSTNTPLFYCIFTKYCDTHKDRVVFKGLLHVRSRWEIKHADFNRLLYKWSYLEHRSDFLFVETKKKGQKVKNSQVVRPTVVEIVPQTVN